MSHVTVYRPGRDKAHRCADNLPPPDTQPLGTVVRCLTCCRYLYVDNNFRGRYWTRPHILDLHIWWRILRWNWNI